MLSDEFIINRGIRQGCPLSPILFSMFINDILNNCDKYGMNIGNKKMLLSLFEDDIVLIVLTETKMKILLRYVFNWANKSDMTFRINKCTNMIIKPLNFVNYPGYDYPTFYLEMYPIPKKKKICLYIFLYPFQQRSFTQTYCFLYGV